ncbi:hypothetical protein AB0D04_23825 [Streptomyces sp. NPDC048483]|uniref:hypothetical protein n=1 Tax=Streptomyces sp. NPDC048483 TaxID=3154927 RepID=UPI00342AE9CA
MPRRRPSAVRGDMPLRAHSRQQFPVIDRLSGACVAHIRRLERTRLWPGAAPEAFWHWSVLAGRPLRHFAHGRSLGCPCTQCEFGYDAPYYRTVLEVVLRHLPRKSARELRVRVWALDARIRGRVLGICADAPDALWWEQW